MRNNVETGLVCFGQLKSRSSTFGSVHSKMVATFEAFLARPFPPEHKKLMFMFRIMIMLMILMLLVGTKLYSADKQDWFSLLRTSRGGGVG